MESSIELKSHNFALITLKERCHFLKQQLKAVDDENVKLKVQIASSSIPKESKSSSLHNLIEEVEQLKKQKEQLSNQVHILATENSNMWSRLSKLTALNKNLSRKFANISDSLVKSGMINSASGTSTDSGTVESEDCRKTLEEMSLRLINGIKLEKMELEKQYAQMVDLHRSDLTGLGQDLAFSSVDGDEDTVMAAVRRHSQKLNQLKAALEQQQALLVVSLNDFQKLKTDAKHNKVNNSVQTEANTEPISNATVVRAVPITATTEVPTSQVQDEQKCPMCALVIQGTPEQFIDHVSEHFDNIDENDQHSFIHLP